uniref:AB hydrolase-1 domain-containing protein n=1 Tax=Compsopogon caeruleus TaxID=31354 RepID=A0A7S1TD49_9RHOD|mmetsp:Transcript_18397/g.38505  ORF Transcript_18397/g.38505 Transcript_18397/m.38505 type:complete len:526 (+) Transcript_18397:1208-2785(+)
MRGFGMERNVLASLGFLPQFPCMMNHGHHRFPLDTEVRVSVRTMMTARQEIGSGEEGTVQYFAYGSNLNPSVLGSSAPFLSPRRVDILDWRPAKLVGYELQFYRTGLPLEPAFANVEISKSDDGEESWWSGEVHGVVFRMSWDAFWRRLWPSEGWPRVADVDVNLYDGKIVQRVKIFTWKPVLSGECAPSTRYARLVIDGARARGLMPEYVSFLLRRTEILRSGIDEGVYSRIFSPQGRLDSKLEEFANYGHFRSGRIRILPLHREKGKRNRTLVYFPGLDGTGLGILPHVSELEKTFDIWTLIIPQRDNLSWDDLLDTVRREMSQLPETCVIIGESMGAAIALALISRFGTIARSLVVVNTATSFSRSTTARLLSTVAFTPSVAYRVTLAAALPVIFDVPYAFSGFRDYPRALDALTKVIMSEDFLPQDALKHRLGYIRAACEELDDRRLRNITTPIQTVATRNDGILPSVDEARRLHSLIGRASLEPIVLNFGGHCCVLDDRFPLSQILQKMEKVTSPYTRTP